MDLLKNYLDAVGKYLPEAQRDDIVRELSANLSAQIDDLEASLGRPATEDEVARVLQGHGHPMIVAARYAPQQYLIGPTLFPVYWYVLGRALPIAALVYGVAVASAVAAGAQPIGEAMLRLPGVLFSVAAWVTLAFGAGEWGMRKYQWDFGGLRNWNPRDLPKAGSPKPQTRAKAICAFAVGLLFTAWIAAVPYYPYLLLGPGAAYLRTLPIRPASFWGMLYWPVVIFFLARCVADLASALRPSWRRQRAWLEVYLHGAWAAVLIFVLQAGESFSLISGRADAMKFQGAVAGLNLAVRIAVAFGLVIALAQVAVAARRVIADVRGRRLARPGLSL